MGCTRARTVEAYLTWVRYAWTKVVVDRPGGFLRLPDVEDWLDEQVGQFHAEIGPITRVGFYQYRFWFSDPDTAFAFKIRWA